LFGRDKLIREGNIAGGGGKPSLPDNIRLELELFEDHEHRAERKI
jgi:hypothetical protein